MDQVFILLLSATLTYTPPTQRFSNPDSCIKALEQASQHYDGMCIGFPSTNVIAHRRKQ